MIHINKFGVDDYFTDIDDYDYTQDYDEDPYDLDIDYEDDEMYCPDCHVRKVKYKEHGECRGFPYTLIIVECPQCGN